MFFGNFGSQELMVYILQCRFLDPQAPFLREILPNFVEMFEALSAFWVNCVMSRDVTKNGE